MDIRKKIIKRLIIVLAVCLALFAIVNIAWLVCIKIPHDRIVDRIYEGSEISGPFEKPTKDGYSFGIKIIKYLSFDESAITISYSGPVLITYDTNSDTDEYEGTSDGTLYGIYCYRNWLGVKYYALDCWMPGNNLTFNVRINKDLSIQESLDMDDDDLLLVEDFVDQNRSELQDMMDYAVELWEG